MKDQGHLGADLVGSYKRPSRTPRQPRPPNVALLKAFWSLLAGIWGLLKASWGVLENQGLLRASNFAGVLGSDDDRQLPQQSLLELESTVNIYVLWLHSLMPGQVTGSLNEVTLTYLPVWNIPK